MFISYAREDSEFVEQHLTRALAAHGKDVWIDVEDIRGGASDWRASVGGNRVRHGHRLRAHARLAGLNRLRGGSPARNRTEQAHHPGPAALSRRLGDTAPLSRPNWIYARPEDDFDTSVVELIEALELDEAWVEQHARLNQRTGEWLRHDRDGSYLLRGSDLRDAEAWLDDQAKHSEAPTANQITYITASRRAATRRLRGLLAGVAVALVLTAILAVAAFVQRERAIDREKTARAQAAAAQSIAELSRAPRKACATHSKRSTYGPTSPRRSTRRDARSRQPDGPRCSVPRSRAARRGCWTSSSPRTAVASRPPARMAESRSGTCGPETRSAPSPPTARSTPSSSVRTADRC